MPFHFSKIFPLSYFSYILITNTTIFFLSSFFIKKISSKPVIGIYGNSYPENNDTYINGTYYPRTYVMWLEAFGADVMAIHYWYSNELIDEILAKVNGILFLGGSRDIIKEGIWEQKAKYLMDEALKLKLPVWATCQGFQLVGVLISDNYTLLRYGFDDINDLHNLEIVGDGRKGRMFSLFKDKDFDLLEKTNSTAYYHNYGIYPDEFEKEEKLMELFKITSISQGHNKIPFVDTYEGKTEDNNFFAVQFHPEKNPYKRINYNVEQNMETLRVSQLLGMKFVEITRNNKNYFDKEDRERFDFFDTYQGKGNAVFNKEDDFYYFSRKY